MISRSRTAMNNRKPLSRMMQGEKWMIFLILCFILILALFNVIGSLSMLMIEKKEDVRTLRIWVRTTV